MKCQYMLVYMVHSTWYMCRDHTALSMHPCTQTYSHESYLYKLYRSQMNTNLTEYIAMAETNLDEINPGPKHIISYGMSVQSICFDVATGSTQTTPPLAMGVLSVQSWVCNQLYSIVVHSEFHQSNLPWRGRDHHFLLKLLLNVVLSQKLINLQIYVAP